MNEILTICFFFYKTLYLFFLQFHPLSSLNKILLTLQLPLPKSLKSSCFVATGALNILIPCLFMVPSRAPALTRLRQRLPLPFI